MNVFPPIDIDLYKTKCVSLSNTVEKKYRFYVGFTAEILAVRVEGPNVTTLGSVHFASEKSPNHFGVKPRVK